MQLRARRWTWPLLPTKRRSNNHCELEPCSRDFTPPGPALSHADGVLQDGGAHDGPGSPGRAARGTRSPQQRPGWTGAVQALEAHGAGLQPSFAPVSCATLGKLLHVSELQRLPL